VVFLDSRYSSDIASSALNVNNLKHAALIIGWTGEIGVFSNATPHPFFFCESPFICKLYRYCKITRGMKRSAQ
jgi:hypothetical protein